MMTFSKGMTCIAALALLAPMYHPAIGAGSDEGRATSHADSVDASGDETAASGTGGPQPPEQSSGVQLLAAVERGDVAEVLKLVESGAYAPGSINGLRALKTAKDRGHAKIFGLLQTVFDKYWEDGVPYDDMIIPIVETFRQRALESPDNSYRRSLAERLTYSMLRAFFQGMSKRDETGLWAPMTERFDENELGRRVTKAFDLLDQELQMRSEVVVDEAARARLPLLRFALQIHQAAARGDVEQLAALLRDGANPNARTGALSATPQSSPLHYAALNGQVGAIRYLVDAGADVNILDGDKQTPLHAASGEGHIEAITALIEAGADPHGSPGEVTPLHSAARNGQVGAIRYLVDAGADVNILDGDKQTPLHAASGEGHIGAISALIETGADPNAVDSEGATPLHGAAYSGHVDAVAALLDAGADARARDNIGRTAEVMANIRSHTETEKLLRDANPAAARTGALHLAATGGDLKEVANLLEAGVGPDVRDERQSTPLHKAMPLVKLGIGHAEVVVALLKAGADPNAQDENRITPLHMAVMFGTVETITTLIAAGADPNLRSAANETPLQLAERLGKSDLVDALR